MSAHHIILDCLPYLCQKLSKLVEIWRSYDKNNVAFYWDTVYTAGYDVPTQNISVNKIYISTYHWLYCGLMLLVGGCEQMWWLCQTVQYVRRSDNVDSFHGSSQIIRYSLLCLSPWHWQFDTPSSVYYVQARRCSHNAVQWGWDGCRAVNGPWMSTNTNLWALGKAVATSWTGSWRAKPYSYATG